MKENFNIKELNTYFPSLSEKQINLYNELFPVYQYWNQRINVISQKDIDQLYIRHILHSLAIAKVEKFREGDKIIDIGTGGGFPGIPLAVMFPESEFLLIDSIGKKVKVVEEVIKSINLKNVSVIKARSNEMKGKFDYITGRAVTAFPRFYDEVKHLIPKKGKILYLKGGDFDSELIGFKSLKIFRISDFYNDVFFETKKIIYFIKN